MRVSVALSDNISQPLTYRHHGDQDLPAGTRVVVPLRNRPVTGWVVDSSPDFHGRIRSLIGIIRDPYIPDHRYLLFSRELADRYLCSRGIILDHSLPPGKKSLRAVCLMDGDQPRPLYRLSSKELQGRARHRPLDLFYRHPGQPSPPRSATDTIPTSPQKIWILTRDRLEYIRQNVLEEEGRKTLLLCTDNITARFYRETLGFGELYTSDLTPAQREKSWERCRESDTGLVIGGLSAAFLPLESIDTIILECSTVFKNLTRPRLDFDITEVARLRARIHHAALHCVSGTPSLQSHFDSETGGFTLQDRRRNGPVPVQIHRLLNHHRRIPPELLETVRSRSTPDNRTLVLVHRRESDRFPFCPDCDRLIRCSRCRALLRETGQNKLECLGCGQKTPHTGQCPRCRAAVRTLRGISQNQVEKALGDLLGGERVFRPAAAEYRKTPSLVKSIRKNTVTVGNLGIIQPFLRGLFDRIFYLQPESYFSLKNLSGAESIFLTIDYLRELLRPEGELTVYSAFFFHYALRNINDEAAFFQRETDYRRWFRLPPYFRLYELQFRHKNRRKLGREMRDFYQGYRSTLDIRRLQLLPPKKSSGYHRGSVRIHVPREGSLETGLVENSGHRLQRVRGMNR